MQQITDEMVLAALHALPATGARPSKRAMRAALEAGASMIVAEKEAEAARWKAAFKECRETAKLAIERLAVLENDGA